MFRFTSYAFFTLAACCLLVGAVLLSTGRLLVAQQDPGKVKHEVERAVQQVMQQAAEHSTQVEALLAKDGLQFNELLQTSQTPFYLYRGRELVFWSDHHFLPEVDPTAAQFTPRVTESRFGRFLLLPALLPRGYLLVHNVPLELKTDFRNPALPSGLNQAIFRAHTGAIQTDSTSAGLRIYDARGRYLFSLQGAHLAAESPLVPWGVKLLLAGCCFLAVWLQGQALRHYRHGRWQKGLALGLGLPVALRLAALLLNFPQRFAELPLFDPRLFAASAAASSVGDLLLSLGVALLAAAHCWYLLRLPGYRLHRLTRAEQSPMPLFVLLPAYFGVVWLLYRAYGAIVNNSNIVLDITRSLQFSAPRVGLLLACLLLTATLFLLTQAMLLLLRPYWEASRSGLGWKTLAGALAIILISWWWQGLGEALALAMGGIYLLLLLLASRQAPYQRVFYNLYVRLILTASVSASVGAIVFYQHQQRHLVQEKQQMANNLLLRNDLLGEYLLAEAGRKIADDPLIRRQLLSPFTNADVIERKITRYYVSSHFSAYQPRVLLFAASGRQLSKADSLLTLPRLAKRTEAGSVKTDYPGLYLQASELQPQARTYTQYIPIRQDTTLLGTIVLELSLRKLASKSPLPAFFTDPEEARTGQPREVSYAIYQNGRLRGSEGPFHYRARFGQSVPASDRLFVQGIVQNGYHHLALGNRQGQVAVISSRAYLLPDSIANFSFLLLNYVAALLLLAALVAVLREGFRVEIWSNLGTKIQVLLNVGVLVPLIVISISIINQITKTYKQDLRNTYQRKGEAIQASVRAFADTDSISGEREEIAEVVAELATFSDSDVQLYDPGGKLHFTSQPLLQEAGLVAQRMNAQAFGLLKQAGGQRAFLREQLGELAFDALYLPFYTPHNQLAGFVGLPFFDSEKELEGKLIQLLSMVMSLFAGIFLASTFFTFLASRALVEPLQLLTDKLKRVTLTKKNEPLHYPANDELGLLVQEYNSMLQKLEESKQELSEREKEQAWREMARQVAHEIKNPLTPMKLSLQYLDYALLQNRPDFKDMVKRTLQTMITQIDVLSDIATSFSSFTNFPEPKSERVSLNSVLTRTADLHDPGHSRVWAEVPEIELAVTGDEDLLVRVFNNLVLNALQAMPAGRQPRVVLRATEQPDRTVLAAVQDNGSGIPEEVREKVFVPNFSTKYAGSGIGLAVARKGIEQMGGRIWFETEADAGTTFFIQLPLAD